MGTYFIAYFPLLLVITFLFGFFVQKSFSSKIDTEVDVTTIYTYRFNLVYWKLKFKILSMLNRRYHHYLEETKKIREHEGILEKPLEDLLIGERSFSKIYKILQVILHEQEKNRRRNEMPGNRNYHRNFFIQNVYVPNSKHNLNVLASSFYRIVMMKSRSNHIVPIPLLSEAARYFGGLAENSVIQHDYNKHLESCNQRVESYKNRDMKFFNRIKDKYQQTTAKDES